MKTLIVTSLVAALVAGCAPSGSGSDTSSAQPAQTPASQPKAASRPLPKACEILTPAEIAGALQAPQVKKDDVNSGENVMTHVDICNWYVKLGSSEGMQVQIYRPRGTDDGSSLLAYSSAKGDAVEHDQARAAQAQQLTGVGDEAIYAPYPDGKGGNVAFRTRAGAATLTGSASHDRLVALARLAASRM